MIAKELKKLSRRELVDIIYQLKKNEQEKQEKIDALEEQLQDKRIHISVAGSIAEAAVDITQLLSNAQRTADLYLHEIAAMKADTEKECAQKLEVAQTKLKEILEDGEKKIAELKASYKRDYMKWKALKAEIESLERKKKYGWYEGILNER